MKKTFIICLSLIYGVFAYAQTLEDQLGKMSTEIAKDLRLKKGYVIAVYPFTSLKGKESNLALHIFDELHTSLKAKEYDFKIMDRLTLDNYLSEHELNSNDLIDQKTAKRFGKLIAADAYVTGKVYVFGSVINLTVKLTNTETGEIVSFNSVKMPIDYDMSEFLEIKNWGKKREKANVNKSQNPNCNSLNIENHCFQNNSGVPVKIVIQTKGSQYRSVKELVIPIGNNGCFKDLTASSYTFKAYRLDRANIVGQSNIISRGDFTIEKCSSKIQNLTKTPIKSTSKGNIITNTNEELFTITINNPNYYAREVTFYDRNSKSESVVIGSKSHGTIQLPKGYYRFESKTTFTKYKVQQSSFKLTGNKSMKLVKDDYN